MSSSSSTHLTLANFASATTTGQLLWNKMPKANAELFALTYGSLITEIIRDHAAPGNNSNNYYTHDDESIEQINEQIYKIGKSIGVRCIDEYLARLDAALPSGAAMMSMSKQQYDGGNNSNVMNSGNAAMGMNSGKIDIDDVHTISTSQDAMSVAGAMGNMNMNDASSNNIMNSNANSSNTAFSAFPACQNFRDTAESIAKIGFKMFLGVTCDVANYSSDGKSFSLYLYEDPLAMFVELPEQLRERNKQSTLKYSNVYCGVICGALEQVNLKVECHFVRDMLCGDDLNEIRVELKEIIADGAGEDYQEE